MLCLLLRVLLVDCCLGTFVSDIVCFGALLFCFLVSCVLIVLDT